MTTESIPLPETTDEQFETGQVAPIVGAHFIHDIYTASVAPLLPVLIEKLSLSLTMAGSLTAILSLPALLNPFIGYLADRVSLRYFVILAPAITATLISSIGFAQSYLALVIIFLATGVSVAAFHAPAPAIIARVSGKQVGLGMSLFMAAGELARTVGPLLAVWAVSIWTLDGFYRIVVLGWGASIILFWRLRSVPARSSKSGSIRELKPFLRSLYLPLVIVLFFRNFMLAALTTYLPTYMKIEGATLWLAAFALSILEFAGVGGALSSGTISDRIGRKTILLVGTAASSIFLFLFLSIDGWLLVPVLLLLGFTAFSSMPVLLAIVQDQLPNHRAVGNGLLLSISFILRSIAVIAIGFVGDNLGLATAYYWSAVLALFAIPAIFLLPGTGKKPGTNAVKR